MARASNRRYCRIVTPNASSNFGIILAIAQSGVYIAYIDGSTNALIMKSDGSGITLSQPNNITTVIDFNSQFAHSIIILGGSLVVGTLSYY